MGGHRPFKDLTDDAFSEARKARVAVHHSELKTEMALHELLSAPERSKDDSERE